MQRFVIEREIPGAKDLTEEQLPEIARTSNEAADHSACPTPGSTATWPATGSTASTTRGRRGHPRARPARWLPGEQGDRVAHEFGPQTAKAEVA